jgi:hypothetical protein
VSALLVVGDRPVFHALDSVRRYCGLAWSGGAPEVWAYPYFDALPGRAEDNEIRATDVLSSAALHPGLSRSDLTFFAEEVGALSEVLRVLPPGVDLSDADEHTVARLVALPDRFRDRCGLALLSKVLHAKRPRLVPMLDRALVDWYRPTIGTRGEAAWVPLLGALRADLERSTNRMALASIAEQLSAELAGPVPSDLRIVDICIWMEGRPS